jgi:hypothetical protein
MWMVGRGRCKSVSYWKYEAVSGSAGGFFDLWACARGQNL